MQKRSVGLVILFSLLTCGIYVVYWYYVTAQDLNREETEQAPLMNFILAWLLGIVTCGIYLLIWEYNFYKKIDKLTGDENALVNFLLALFFTPIAGMGIAQNSINGYLDRA